VRPAAIGDVSHLARCRLAMFTALEPRDRPASEADFVATCEKAIAKSLADRRAAAWVAESTADSKLIGSAILLRFPRLPTFKNPGTEEGYLGTVFVEPSWRRKGVAGALTAAVIAFAKRAGLARIRLHAAPDGRPIYERAGFTGRSDEMELNLLLSQPS
jgi:GNAT superfamily N-acetyltransferase